MSLIADGANALRQAWSEGRPTYGAWCSVPNSFVAEIMGHAGFDWACIDLQHGLAGADSMVPMLQALASTRTPTLVRVPWNEPAGIMRALDLGAVGVIVPMVNNSEAARAAVQACRYAPDGARSYGPTRAALLGGDAPTETLNGLVVCAVMVETREAVEDLDEILSTPGVDVVFVGPQDLRISLGLADVTAEDFTAVLADIASQCHDRGVVAGIFCPSLEVLPRWRQLGYRMLALESDVRFLRAAATNALARARGADETRSSGGTGYA